MITSLELKNFQTHKRLKLDLNHPVTTIIGASDKGKSAILRALQWVALNQPSGCEFMNWDAEDVSVRVTVDGQVVERSSTGTTNLYKVGDEEYKAFGRAVPEPIANLLRLSPLNFQGQHDAPFWFSLSPAEVSRQLNQIVNLELIDKTMSKLDSMLRNARAVVADRDEQVLATRKERKRLRFVAQISAELEAVKELEADSNSKQEKANSLSSSLAKVKECMATAVLLAEALAAAPLAAGQRLQLLQTQRQGLAALITEAEGLAATAGLPAPDTAQLGGLAKQASTLTRQRDNLEAILTEAEAFQWSIDDNQERLGELEAEIHKLTKGKCPLCGKRLE